MATSLIFKQHILIFNVFNMLIFMMLLVSFPSSIECLNYRPQFTRPLIITSILENSPSGSTVTKLSDFAQDDEGDVITYSIDTVGQSYCSVDSVTGLVTLSKLVDREITDLVQFTAYAEDNFEGGGAARRGEVKVFIYVLDVNEWSPEFQGTPYHTSIYENASIGDPVLTVSANDKDDGSNAEIKFEFKTGTQIPQFSLDSNSGSIKVAGRLDYEAVTRYTLSVVAKDKGDSPLSSETRVIVDINDVSDTAPIFSPSSSYEARANENLPVNTKITKVFASDGDKGVNNAIEFQIYSDNSGGRFAIDKSSGDIKANGTLDREKASVYYLKIKAYEVAMPSSFALADVVIQLNDVNDFRPTFSSDSYSFTIDEDKPEGFIISKQLTATDADSTVANREFQYSLSGDSSKFAVDSISGQLTVNANLDYETQPKFNFIVLATETLSAEKLSGNATVTVNINNINDNSPVFNQSNYVFNVMENSQERTVVGFVKASDSDKGLFGKLTYSLNFASQPASLLFQVNSSTGEISLKRVPDYEAFQSHEFQATATDGGGINAKASSSNVRVDILDLNDNYPVFTNLPTKINVPENKPARSIFTIKATDRDSSVNGQVKFKLMNSSIGEFAFDETSGILNTTAPLDYESSKKKFILLFMASDNGDKKRNATQTLEINVQDENDHTPRFNQSVYNTTITENAKIGSLVINLNATDLDSGLNSKITYQIISGNDRNTFSISAISGEIKTQDVLDRETVDIYELQIRASDHGSPSLTTTTKVVIRVEDFNDNYPNFLQPSYSVKVNESAAIGQVILVLQARDGDIGENGRISYFITSGNYQGKFKLANDTGKLTIAKSLNWETTSTYNLNVKAEDDGDVKNSRNTFVTIDVIDNNDNSPIFTESQYSFQIFENTPGGRSVGRVTAEDEDGKLPPNTNGVVKYFITSGNEKGLFTIDENVGIIQTNGSVDRETTAFFNMTIIAKDGGYPQISATISATINIIDLNDNAPSFQRANYTVKVPENVTIGSVVAELKAADIDSGINSKLSYTISSGNDGNAFAIQSNGDLTIASTVDRESLDKYLLKITALDSGSPQMSSSVDVAVVITDVNDNKPVFIETPYTAIFVEEQPSGRGVFQVKAVDADFGENSLITYSIVQATPSNVFKINETNGKITTTSVIDREIRSNYVVNVSAKDHGKQQLTSFTVLTVSIADINDNKPIIKNLPNRTMVSEDAAVGSSVFDIEVNDEDYGDNARLSYVIASGDFGKFSVSNGRILTQAPLNREDNGVYVIVVNITDHGNPPFMVSSSVEIIITDVNDNTPLFIPNPILNSALYIRSIPEGQASINVTVFDVNATDADSGVNGLIHFSITSGNELGYFHIDPVSGKIKVFKLIDREAAGIGKNLAGLGMFALNVKATDQASMNARFATTTVTILISDVNDNRPLFGKHEYYAGISEGADVSSAVVTVSASDKDTGLNARIKYSIVHGNTNGDFAILNQFVGTVSVAKLLNAEETASYNLTILAKDDGESNGGISLNSTVIVQIRVGDLNDNDPVFNQSDYKASIRENIATRHRVIQVSASDADQGTNGEVWYQIISGNIDKTFEINNRTGNVYAIAPIDREKVSKFTLTIKAEDKGQPSSRKSIVELVISVDDVNDNPTKFKANIYVGHVTENSAPGTLITLSPLIAFDDVDQLSTTKTLFLAEPGFENFTLNSTSYTIATSRNSSFDRETTAIFYLKIIVRDNDGLSSESNLIVIVDDVNDNSPVFNESYSVVNISESAPVGESLLRLTASDRDDGINAKISYTIRGADATFIFNQTTGMVQLNKKLDREMQALYRLEVIAVDQGRPSLDGKAIVDVHVVDVIDSAPYFDPSVIDVNVNETLPVDSIIFTLKAKDKDLNDKITYASTSSTHGQFQLNSTTGQLKLTKSLDRENRTSHEMTFQATDSVSLSSPISGLTLRIKVLDANDNEPKFLQPFYTNDVVENTPDGTIVMSVVATDADTGQNAKIKYSILENVSDLIRIDAEKGLISKYGVWKTSSGGFLNFTVIASDSGNPSRSSEVRAKIRWVPVNALNPKFNQSLYSVLLSENAAPGSEVIQLTAYKRGKVEPVTFSMTGGQGSFFIESSTGIIRVSKSPDREKQERYAITVTATDDQSPPQNGVTSVTITLTDVNDFQPVFSADVYRFSVYENANLFSVIGSVVAVDQDVGNNSKLTYSLLSGNERNWFSINPLNGTIRAIQELDRELQETSQLIVMARDHGIKPLNKTASVVITILDINDNIPTFGKDTYNISVREDLPGDNQVASLVAKDGDKGQNGTIFYSIVSGNELGHFYIGRTTGLIRIAKLLDFESRQLFNLTILAIDNGVPFVLSSVALVFINVIDVNDNAPRFLASKYWFSMKENSQIGQQIGHVSAVDKDESYNTIYYGIQNAASGVTFRISEKNGTIVLAQNVDREAVAKYIFNVEAYNKDQYGNISLKSFAEITVQIIDVNDNIPQFISQNCCNVSILENSNIGDVILRNPATDADAGSNKEITYSIVTGNDNGEFKIDAATGDLKLMKSLDHERAGHYKLIVNARDHGIPMMSSNATIRIEVLDVNDMAPVFRPLNVSTISEDVSLGEFVTKVTAVDKDTGDNGKVFYEVISGNSDDTFALATATGEITVAKTLDFERVSYYKLRIMARDRGTPSLSSFTTVEINVTNVNDNEPTFLQGTLYASVRENMPAGSTVATILAPDADEDPVYYYIQGGNEDAFNLDENSGILTTKISLDREIVQVYAFTIQATNNKKPNNLARSKRAMRQGSFSTQNVIIQVEDENDNSPKFTEREYRAGVSANAKYGTRIIQVAAIDLDSGNNSNIAYLITYGQNEDMFVLERKTGWLKSAQLFTGKVGRNFELGVVAQDNDGIRPFKNDTTLVKIFVLTDKQRVVLTMKVDPQTVRDNQEEFRRVLQNITSFKINIDEIQYSTKNGEIDTSSTDLTFHAVDKVTNEIQERDVVIKAIEQNQENYQEFFQKWNVQSVKAVVVPTSAPPHDDTQTILIAVAAALLLIIIGFVFALCHLRRKQRRKLNAATASSKHSDATVELEHMQKLNNIVKGSVSGKSQIAKSLSRASERFYPMWVEPKDENFDSVRQPCIHNATTSIGKGRPLMASFRIKRSSASYYEENKSMNTISNTRTLTTEIIMMQDPYIGETDVDYYPDGEDFYASEDMSDMFDSQTDEDIDRDFGSHSNPIASQTLSKEELLLRASLQPMATLELDGVNVTSI